MDSGILILLTCIVLPSMCYQMFIIKSDLETPTDVVANSFEIYASVKITKLTLKVFSFCVKAVDLFLHNLKYFVQHLILHIMSYRQPFK